MLHEAVKFIRSHDAFLLIAHVSPDGDTLGSSLALRHALVAMGKAADVVCEDPVPAIYRFMPGAGGILAPGDAPRRAAVIAVDCADLMRTGACETLVRGASFTLNIDHHATNTGYLQANYVFPAAAAGELIYHLLVKLGVEVTRDIAACLYTAIVTDTGNFAYSNTTPDTLRIAAELLDTGIDLPALNRLIFRTIPLHKMKLLGLAITKTRLYETGRVGISTLTLSDMRLCGATAEDTEGVIDSIRDIDTVEVAALLRQGEDGDIRVSLRGKRFADVSVIATSFGGGGHRLAAGCTLHCSMEEASERILAAASKLLRAPEG